MANPLQTICGMSQTLLEMPDLPREKRLEMLAAIHAQAVVLSNICLDPAATDLSETTLRPRPFD